VEFSLRNELMKGMVHLSRRKEFYGHIIQQFEKVYVDGDHPVNTAAVGRRPGERFIKLYFNEDFFNGIFKEHGMDDGRKFVMGVQEHEIIHVVCGHLFLEFQDPTRGNVAKDCVVNCMVDREALPGKYVHPDNYGFEENKSAMWYYTHLRDNPEYKRQCAAGEFGKGGELSHVMSSHGMWEDVKDDQLAKEFAKDIVRKAKDLSGKGYGNLPGALREMIDELLKTKKPIIPWGKVLRMFCASALERVLDYTVKRVSRRFGTRPGTRKGDVLKLAVAIDTSGSISDDELKLFWSEIRWIWRNGAIIDIFECDTKISERSPFKFTGKWDGEVHGRGGTSLEPVLKEVVGKYDALIYFTDFEAPTIETRYRIPILWVLTNEMDEDDYPYKWGRVIKIDTDKLAA